MKFDNFKHNAMLEEITDALAFRTNLSKNNYLRNLVCFHLAKIVSILDTKLITYNKDVIPVNLYTMLIAPSGYGKGYTDSVIKANLTDKFFKKFGYLFRQVLREKLIVKIQNLVESYNLTHEEAKTQVIKEKKQLGCFLTSFESGTVAGIKQARSLIQLVELGSLNYEVDEIGLKLVDNYDLLKVCLELFDGVLSPKLIKNSRDEIRLEDTGFLTPANVKLMGSIEALLDGANTEELLHKLLISGYARRLFFACITEEKKITTVEDRLKALDNADTVDFTFNKYSSLFTKFADVNYKNLVVTVSREATELSIEYQVYCEHLARSYVNTNTIKHLECSNRHFKCLKLAAVFAFLDESFVVSRAHLESAILVAEDSAKSLDKLLESDPPHVRLTNYLVNCNKAVTHSDLIENLKFYPKTSKGQDDLFKLATAYAYQKNVLIKKTEINDINFFTAKSMLETAYNNSSIICSLVIDDNYTDVKNTSIAIKDIKKVLNHKNIKLYLKQFTNNEIEEYAVKSSFNCICMYVYDELSLKIFEDLFKDFTYVIKKDVDENALEFVCTILLYTKYIHNLSNDDYRDFVENMCDVMPIQLVPHVDELVCIQSNDNSEIIINEKNLFDSIYFENDTIKNAQLYKYYEDKSKKYDKIMLFLDSFISSKRDKIIKLVAFYKAKNENEIFIENKLKLFSSLIKHTFDEYEIKSYISGD